MQSSRTGANKSLIAICNETAPWPPSKKYLSVEEAEKACKLFQHQGDYRNDSLDHWLHLSLLLLNGAPLVFDGS